jgi:hypothetical protein
MAPFKILIGLGLMCWSTIVFGFRRGWVKRSEIFDYAVTRLVNDSHADSEDVAIIAGGEYLSDDELLGLMSKQVERVDSASDLEKWLLAFLLWIEASGNSDQDKINRLQEVYADFNYPENMASCSVYSQDSISPLFAMGQVVEVLRERFSLR